MICSLLLCVVQFVISWNRKWDHLIVPSHQPDAYSDVYYLKRLVRNDGHSRILEIYCLCRPKPSMWNVSLILRFFSLTIRNRHSCNDTIPRRDLNMLNIAGKWLHCPSCFPDEIFFFLFFWHTHCFTAIYIRSQSISTGPLLKLKWSKAFANYYEYSILWIKWSSQFVGKLKVRSKLFEKFVWQKILWKIWTNMRIQWHSTHCSTQQKTFK